MSSLRECCVDDDEYAIAYDIFQSAVEYYALPDDIEDDGISADSAVFQVAHICADLETEAGHRFLLTKYKVSAPGSSAVAAAAALTHYGPPAVAYDLGEGVHPGYAPLETG